MLEIFRPVQNILQMKTINTVDLVWRLHSRVTVGLLLFACLLLTARQYFGKPIDCITGFGTVTAATMNDFCWTMGTYINNDPKFALEGTDLLKINAKIGHIPESNRSYQKYYQWVVFILALQACLFSLPNILWKVWEAGRLQSLCDGLTPPIVPDQWKQSRKDKLVNYLMLECPQLYKTYFMRYCFCMVLNFGNVLLNIFFVNMIFSGFWINYQPAITALLSFDFPSWNHYNSQVFPKFAKCDFHFVGPSGTVQNRDSLCILPLNVLNEKIFAFIWVWFIVLLLVSWVNLLYWMAVLCFKTFRIWLLKVQLQPMRTEVIMRALKGQGIGKWFLLHQLFLNLNPIVSRELIMSMAKRNKSFRKENHKFQEAVDI